MSFRRTNREPARAFDCTPQAACKAESDLASDVVLAFARRQGQSIKRRGSNPDSSPPKAIRIPSIRRDLFRTNASRRDSLRQDSPSFSTVEGDSAFYAIPSLEVLASADRLGPTFLQLPAQFGPERLRMLARCLAQLPREFPWGVEVRHPAFFAEGAHERAFDELLARRRPRFLTVASQSRMRAGVKLRLSCRARVLAKRGYAGEAARPVSQFA